MEIHHHLKQTIRFHRCKSPGWSCWFANRSAWFVKATNLGSDSSKSRTWRSTTENNAESRYTVSCVRDNGKGNGGKDCLQSLYSEERTTINIQQSNEGIIQQVWTSSWMAENDRNRHGVCSIDRTSVDDSTGWNETQTGRREKTLLWQTIGCNSRKCSHQQKWTLARSLGLVCFQKCCRPTGIVY